MGDVMMTVLTIELQLEDNLKVNHWEGSLSLLDVLGLTEFFHTNCCNVFNHEKSIAKALTSPNLRS